MRSDDKAKDDVSPPAGYGNKPAAQSAAEREAEFNRQRADAQAQRAAHPRGDQPTDIEIARYVFLRDKANRTAAEESEFDQLDARIDDPPPPLAPLTPAEVGKLAEQRADPAQQPDPELVAREGVDQPPLGPEDRDPEKVMPALIDVVSHMAAIVVALVGAVPGGHAQAPRAREMLDALGLLLLHSSPEAEKPPKIKK